MFSPLNVCEYSLTMRSISGRRVSVNWTFGQDRARIWGGMGYAIAGGRGVGNGRLSG
jgi:hypothetical protein